MDKYLIRKDVYKQLAKSFLNAESIEKARGLPEGSVRTWGGKDYKKLGGEWIPVGKGRKGAGPEEKKEKGKTVEETTETNSKEELPNDIRTALESYVNAGMKQDQVVTALEGMVSRDKFGKGPAAEKNKARVTKMLDMLKKDSSLLENMGSKKAGESSASESKKETTYTFSKAGKTYNVPASSPEEAVQKLKSKGVKGFTAKDAHDDSEGRKNPGPTNYSEPENKTGNGDDGGNKTPGDLDKVTSWQLDVARNQMNTTPKEDQMLNYFVDEMHDDGTSLKEIIERQDGIYQRSKGRYPEDEKTYKSLRQKIMKHFNITDDTAGGGSTHAEGDIVQFKDATGKLHNGKVLLVGKDSVTVLDNVTKNTFDVGHDDIKVLAKVNDNDAIREFYDASGMKPGWRDGSDGNQPDNCDTLEGLLEAAEEVRGEFSELSDKRQELFKSALGVNTILLKRDKLKSAERIKEKLRTDASEIKDKEKAKEIYDEETDTYHCYTIRDTDGHTFTCRSIDDLQKVFNYFKDQPDIIRMKNNFANPTDVGYSDINMNIRLSNDTIAEIQLNTTANIVAKERYGHSLYEIYRSIKNDPEYEELASSMAKAQSDLYRLSNKYSKDGTFPDIKEDEVFSKDFKHKPYADAIRQYVSESYPLYLKAKKAGKLNKKTISHFEALVEYIK